MTSKVYLSPLAITRAMKELYITDAEQSNNQQKKLPSRFMFEVPDELFERLVQLPEQMIAQIRMLLLRQPKRLLEKPAQTVGARVTHPIFGTGTIQEEKGLIYLVAFSNGVKPIQKSFTGLKWE